MTAERRLSRRIADIFQEECVGCGCCMKACRQGAITVPKGIFAVVDFEKCTGCGLCARECPASVIKITDRNNEQVVMKVGAY
jgi:Na+-translocating ferredoxin:NAD+ oxidoreductase RNF subunit RnfB